MNNIKREPYPVEIAGATAIGPEVPSDWASSGASSLYWSAHRRFTLPEVPRSAEITVACDRHYEIYFNSHRAVHHRNFFNGDRYILAQTWNIDESSVFKTGINSIDVVIRSDPWQCKNHRALAPLLILKATLDCSSQVVSLATDNAWKIALISNWREEIARGVNGTIHFERIRLSPITEAKLAGFSSCMETVVAATAFDRIDLPPFLLWNDPPKRTLIRRPQSVETAGRIYLPEKVLVLDDVARLEELEKASIRGSLRSSSGERELRFAASALLPVVLCVNGKRIWAGGEAPGAHQMSLPDYLIPAGSIRTRPGANTFTFDLTRPPKGWSPFRMAIHGVPRLISTLELTLNGQAVSGSETRLELSESVSAQSVSEDTGCIHWNDRKSSLVIKADGESRCAVFDFEFLMTGRLSMKIASADPASIYLAYGSVFSDGALDCHRMHMRMVDVLDIPAGKSLYEAFDVRTFRFLEILALPSACDITVEDIRVEEMVYLDNTTQLDTGVQQPETSDPALTAIWRASLLTSRMCCNELFMDNPEREHSQWVDCTVAVGSAAYYGFGEERKTRKALLEIAWTQRDDGQVAGYAPGKWFPRLPLQCHMALLVLGWHRHFMHTGDREFAAELLPTVTKMIDHWNRHIGDHGLIEDLHTVFVDWGSHVYSYGRNSRGKTGALTSLNAYYLGVLRRTIEVLGYLDAGETYCRGQDGELRIKDLQVRADRLAEAMRTHLFDSRLGIFRDGIGDPAAESNYSQTVNALAVLFGAALPATEKTILTSIFDPAPDLLSRIPGRFIPANAHFARQAGMALFQAGCDELALQWLTSGFEPMTCVQPGTLWETWQPLGSRCQATGAAPAFLFSRYLTGVYPHTPAYESIGIDPHPGSLRRLAVRLITPCGRLAIRWRRRRDTLDYHLTLPEMWRGRDIVLNENSRLRAAVEVEYCDEWGDYSYRDHDE